MIDFILVPSRNDWFYSVWVYGIGLVSVGRYMRRAFPSRKQARVTSGARLVRHRQRRAAVETLVHKEVLRCVRERCKCVLG